MSRSLGTARRGRKGETLQGFGAAMGAGPSRPLTLSVDKGTADPVTARSICAVDLARFLWASGGLDASETIRAPPCCDYLGGGYFLRRRVRVFGKTGQYVRIAFAQIRAAAPHSQTKPASERSTYKARAKSSTLDLGSEFRDMSIPAGPPK